MKNQVYEKVTAKIIEKLESGVLPWKQKWRGKKASRGYLTGHIYTGINRLLTSFQIYNCPFWATYHQISELGGKVNKGESALPLLWFKLVEDRNDPNNKFPVYKYYNVFNLEQTNLTIPVEEENQIEFKPIEAAEKIIANYKNAPDIRHEGYQAFYNRKEDYINMPPKELFSSVEAYFEVLFHEATHSTSHHLRLNREPLSKEFNKEDYSYEELVAQLGSAYICCEAKIDAIEESASYINGWLKYLNKNGARTLVTAASDAQKAVNYILNKRVDGITLTAESGEVSQS